MSADAFHGIAAVHRAAPLAEIAPLLFTRIRTEDNIFVLNSQIAQKSHPELMRAPHVQHSWNSTSNFRAVFTRWRGGRRLCEPCLQRWERHSWFSRFLL